MRKHPLLGRTLSALFLLAIIVGTVLILRKSSRENTWQTASGEVFGTFYEVKYKSPVTLDDDIHAQLLAVDDAFSIFNDSSVVSRLNRGDSLFTDTLFTYGLIWADRIARDTRGAFDYTVAPLVNAWGFGFKSGDFPTSAAIDSLRAFVGYDKVYWEHSLEHGGLIRRSDPRMMFDFGGIAKGYGVDCVARALELHGVTDYMVSIGGEVIVRGRNDEGQPWRVGVEEPIDDRSGVSQKLNKIFNLERGAIATSGNYHNFYYRDGRKISHTIDPRTGQPAKSGMLSASVFAPICMQADALATAFMVMGSDSARNYLNHHPDVRAYLIYEVDGDRRYWLSPGLEAMEAK